MEIQIFFYKNKWEYQKITYILNNIFNIRAFIL